MGRRGRCWRGVERGLAALGAAIVIAACGPPAARSEPVPGVVEGTYQVGALADRHVRYLRAGPSDSPRVIYIHGTPGDAQNWLAYLERRVSGFEAWAIDRPGFGGSSLARQPGHAGGTSIADDAIESFAAQAAAVEPLLVRQGGRWPVLVGHSLGGPIACRLAAEHPDKVAGLVILAGSLDPEHETLAWYNEVAEWSLLSWMLERSLRVANREVLAAKKETTLLQPLLRNIRCPVVIVHGRKDDLVPFANVAYMTREFTGAASVRVVDLPDAGHFLPWAEEEHVREAVESMLMGEGKP
ncbi:MAG: alpha/beta fold hydrolase [Phycisphaerales bacterium]